jgi:UDP-glucose 4-epimerase
MRIVVLGATGNVGTALLRALRHRDGTDEVVGVARRHPGPSVRGDAASWIAADIARDPLDFLGGADAVVHLAWKIQPSHDEGEMRATNVDGSGRVLDAVGSAGVPRLVYASSVGTYAPGPKEPRVDESWPATGIDSSTYSRHKAAVERMLDRFEADHPDTATVRLRTSLVFQRRAASEVHRLFLGRWAPWRLPRPLRVVPRVPRLVAQATHADDIADAYVRAILGDATGAFNVAAESPLTPEIIAEVTGSRLVPAPAGALRAAASVTYRARLHPAEPGWLDMALETPLMDTTRARAELGWRPARTGVDALRELLAGIADGAGDDTAPLHPRRHRREAA